jgi:hypothetical protein
MYDDYDSDETETYLIPGERTTVYMAATVYVTGALPDGKGSIAKLMIAILPTFGDDPLSGDDVRELARRDDRENWDEVKYGPFRDAKPIRFEYGIYSHDTPDFEPERHSHNRTLHPYFSVYSVESKRTNMVMQGIVPIDGHDPVDEDELKEMCLDQDREKWPRNLGPYRDAELKLFTVNRIVI